MQIRSFLKASFSDELWISQSGHFFVIFWILGNLPQIQARTIQKITKTDSCVHVFSRSTFYIWRIHSSRRVNSSFCSRIRLLFCLQRSLSQGPLKVTKRSWTKLFGSSLTGKYTFFLMDTQKVSTVVSMKIFFHGNALAIIEDIHSHVCRMRNHA